MVYSVVCVAFNTKEETSDEEIKEKVVNEDKRHGTDNKMMWMMIMTERLKMNTNNVNGQNSLASH